MRTSYEDIIEKAGPPKWFDEFGVPRYRLFKPECVANAYAREAALVRVNCRSCGSPFDVAFSWPTLSPVPKLTIAQLIESRLLNFGDPPNTKCCSKSPYLGTVTRHVIEYWSNSSKSWIRDHKLEKALY